MVGRLRASAFAALLLMLLAVLLSGLSPAAAEDAKPMRGVALVIGQSRYEHLTSLPNPANDARAVDRLLGELGFDVTPVTDGDKARLDRSLQRFIEDAEGADVALLYYSGHGIEAGGENYLVPVGADPSSLADAGKNLVALSGLLAELKAKVPVAIVLLDACRTNPFPPGATITTASGPAAVAAAGLDLARGAAPLADATDAPQSLGEVIGFAAEPGHAALDGDAGGNSPYAAALLKHLAAGGFAFGDVMTMVTEEVYVKTGGRQRPWTNASLRRLLYFGLSPEQATGDEASIRGERRKLLLTIATTPADTRSMVEQVAAYNGVPLDALYGMLNVLEVDTSGGRQDLQGQLFSGAQRLKSILAERDVQVRQDPELIRLSGLADQAETEGTIALALKFRSRASLRAEDIGKVIDEAEANVKARRLELAETFVSHAKTALLNFDYRTAAERYGDAFVQAERWDPDNAFLYKVYQADALTDLGKFRGDNAALQEALGVYQQAKLLPGVRTYGGPAGVAVNEGITLMTLADRENGTKWLEQSIRLYEDALKSFSRKRSPEAWATVQLNLGNAYDLMGQRGGGGAYAKKGLAAFRQAEKVYTKELDPSVWAGIQNNIGNALVSIGLTGDGKRNFGQAATAFQNALTVWKRETVPVNWAMAQSNLGVALRNLGDLEDGTKNLEAAVVAFHAAIEVRTRETQPMDWASSQNNLGGALQSLGLREDGIERYQQSLEALKNAQLEITRERDPVNWSSITYNIGRSYKLMAEREDSVPLFQQGLQAIELALTELNRETSPELWGRANSVRGEILFAIGSRTHDKAKLVMAKDAYVTAREVFREQKFTTAFETFYASQLKLIDEELAKAP